MAVDPEQPFNREESYLANAAGEGVEVPPCPWSRKEAYLAEIGDRIGDVEQEVEDLKNNPDVTDIVATYADLQAYDKSKLTDKDIIRVLNDETHDGNSTYYRYDKQLDSFTYIGSSKTYDVFVGTDGTEAGTAGLVPAPAATDADKFLKSDGTWGSAGGGGPTVVQTTGTSQTDVMSQKATTGMVYKDTSTLKGVQVDGQIRGSLFIQGAVAIGGRADDGGIAIGYNNNGYGANAKLSGSIAIGQNAVAGGSASTNAVAIGGNAQATAGGAVALGRFAKATTQGQMDIGVSNATWAASEGYSGTQYRLLTGLYEGQDLHDAATVAQGNKLSSAAPTTSTVGVLGQLYTDTTTMHTYQLGSIDTTDPSNPVYNWIQRW